MTGSRVRRRFVITTIATNLLLLLCNINTSCYAATNRIHTRRRIVVNATQSGTDNTTVPKTITPGPFYTIKMNATDETYYAEMGDTEDQLKHTPDIVPCVIQERKVDPITKKVQKPSLYCEKDDNYLLLGIHENTNENTVLYTDAYGHIRKSRLDNSPVGNPTNTTKTAPKESKQQQQSSPTATTTQDDYSVKSHIVFWYLCFTLVMSLAFVALFFVYCTCCCCEKEQDEDNKSPYYEKDTDFSEVDFVEGHKRFYDNIDYEDDDNVTVASADDLQEVDLGR